MSQFLTGTLNEVFGRGQRAKPVAATTKVVATFDGIEQDVVKDRKGLWSFCLNGERYSNSRLGDLIHQIEGFGGSVERRAL